jgi:catechol 2,3-dioxygenase-like lactoylglutathione lyase family enzyme
MIAHIGLYVKNVKDSGAFYVPALKTLGYEIIFQNDLCIALGKEGVPFFEIYADKPSSSPIHIAFECKSKEEVTLFHNAAIDLGATDNGKPGYRDYFPNYYACYVIDPDGHNLEALFWNKSQET